ncbi:class II Aldolase and Adducin domain-containing protein [Drepanopeziza brunnea f. sp. 'multigermtubi' MB_m1]|uniref:Class II Aldolase and Adducin domain-containing protein n=1 Tax=Marssonina brunnea f. sp. multigermtubi (strain MB_m1) TaxID=1072389 RepID=K1XGE7_MARBU|nr:class II Aldolase and Adducin domain-containing protein [Drepanopeziza brunnea f. sp. 'multigermtubi' MB_m1]EKD19893.1 class II Aldolase and Adducin domain-containing protein [Drepanopeziza brunnea f. sp. 'multigermtubi' MB_m1]
MSGDKAPALVSSQADLIPYNVSDASPVDPKSKKGYQERFIHSEIYKRFPHVNSVVHSHSEAVLPYTMSGVPMRPTFHIAGFLGPHVPTFDIKPLYKPEDQQDMLVNSQFLGSSLASKFSAEGSPNQARNVVLMTSHGFTTVGTSIQQAVYRAIYTHANANVQTNALLIRNASMNLGSGSSTTSPLEDMRYLDDDQVAGSLSMNDASQDRPWALWVREVEASPLYSKSSSRALVVDKRFLF